MIYQRFKKLFKSEKGEIAFAVAMAVSLYLFFFGTAFTVNTVQMWQYKSDLIYAGKEAMGVMRVENGSDTDTRKLFYDNLKKLKIDGSKVSYQATGKTVQRKDKLEIVIQGHAYVWAYELLGVKNYQQEVNVTIPGNARKLIR